MSGDINKESSQFPVKNKGYKIKKVQGFRQGNPEP
jgi:hypothetical protein